MARSRDHLERESLYRASFEDDTQYADDEGSEYELGGVENPKASPYLRLARLPSWTPRWNMRTRRRSGGSRLSLASFSLLATRRRRSLPLCVAQLITLFFYFVFTLVTLCGVLFPSYSHQPPHYVHLSQRIQALGPAGRGNIHNEKVFIAASIYDNHGHLLGGEWGERLRQLIEIIGPENVFLSIYQNDVDEGARLAMDTYAHTVSCENSIVHEKLDLAPMPHVTTLGGTSRLKRIAFLAEVRNRALRPLTDPQSPASRIRFDKVLYLNDVFFEPADAANLLFSTNLDERSGRTNYRAACAVDFINPFKFYDTFATRDTEGYQMGVPFYPWFAAAGNATSRHDTLAQRDAVRVKSCWGGMVAFEAAWFQPHIHIASASPSPVNTSALRFRAEPDTYWDSSECCLIHADLAELTGQPEPGIYMNPYVRVAYSSLTLRWLPFTRRFERLYPWVQGAVNRLAGLPRFNPRRLQRPGERVVDKVWVWDEASRRVLQQGGRRLDRSGLNGTWAQVVRTATAGGFCGLRSLLYIDERPEEGGRGWAFEDVP